MKLFLASEAKHPQSIEKMNEFIGGFEGKSIAYIPTAANGENPYGEWEKESSTWKLVNTLGAKVTPVVLEDYKDKSVVEILKGKDIIWFHGGACGYLMYWIRRCELDKHLPKLLEEGSMYVGSSAGSMITASTLKVTEWYLGESEPGASIFPGFGFVDFEIYPHFEDGMLPEIKKHWNGGKICLLKNGEVITVVDGKVTILGEKRFLEGETK
ncbi:Type 1 glutamine amidotransferase-like domain-containing protein [Candidatus Woesebacteria bacterium]|nr:MAG: Type 1 glutamine amidotransferase-like domain-containing protein [Candidatus Woesebacteria bacterium]